MDTLSDSEQPSREGKFSYQSVQDAESLAAYLRALADGIERGSILFERKDARFVMSPSGLLGFAVEAKAKEGRMKLALKLAWREKTAEKEREEDLLVVRSGGGE
ncbi:hypothetical protein NNJEOMEG_03589 [Fundidesulfovibrio magnetotacticus]|uniref:Amphi-Trp domain-containing protein n=1 Tax=Fundidesulfovibrio magnetotacticus TaxID=2730080 RepID=A0A6V8LYR0_9BACT|nr:amphi-Trp domain-containing protein [Fundidesulfovibrio magnetotacticus]GFK95721.1 hypothetical protein NNJEOMEG_03589 [Fundidesulfovibrio magnetotacticus]